MIPGHDQCAKTETTAAFHDFGATINEHDFFGRIAPLRRRSVLMTGIWSSALSWSALSWCCHEIKTLVHLRAPRRPALRWIKVLISWQDRKSTRLNSSHSQISYAVFCLKKKKNINN